MTKNTSLIVPCLLLLFLTGCTIGGVDVEQETATGLAGELLDGHSFGQTFTPQENGLYRIDLYTATYARENAHDVIFEICSTPSCQDGAELLNLEIPANQISNSGPTIITFPSITETAGLSLYFSVASPGSVPGDAISVYISDQDVYPTGQMYIDGQPVDGDIAFIAYTRESFSAANIWNDFYSRASQDSPFFIFYCSLLGLVILALVVTIAWLQKQPDEESNNRTTPPDDDGGES